MTKSPFWLKHNLSILVLITYISTINSGEIPIYPILSNLEYISKLHLLSQTSPVSLYENTTSNDILQIAKELENFPNHKNLEKVINRTNLMMAGSLHDKCVSRFYAGYVFVFKFLDSILSLDLTKDKARNRLLDLVSGKASLSKMTLLAMTSSLSQENSLVSKTSLETQFEDQSDSEVREERVNSKCFAEGAIQGFEFNFESFENGKPLVVQTSIKLLVEEILNSGKKEKLPRESCVSENDQELESIFYLSLIHI